MLNCFPITAQQASHTHQCTMHSTEMEKENQKGNHVNPSLPGKTAVKTMPLCVCVCVCVLMTINVTAIMTAERSNAPQ